MFFLEFEEKCLTFAWVWCKLLVGTGGLPCELRIPSSLYRLFQQKHI